MYSFRVRVKLVFLRGAVAAALLGADHLLPQGGNPVSLFIVAALCAVGFVVLDARG